MSIQNTAQFWQSPRSPISTRLIFASAETLKKVACSYFEWCTANPLITYAYRGKDNQLVSIEKLRPFTLSGLCAHLGCNRRYWERLPQKLTEKRLSPQTKELLAAIDWINAVIYEQKFSAVAAGLMHPCVLARGNFDY